MGQMKKFPCPFPFPFLFPQVSKSSILEAGVDKGGRSPFVSEQSEDQHCDQTSLDVLSDTRSERLAFSGLHASLKVKPPKHTEMGIGLLSSE